MDIKNISGINEINKVAKTERTRNTGKTDGVHKTDSVEISHNARRSAEVQKYIDIVKNSSDVRRERIEAVKQKMKNGEYDKPEVYDKIAENLTKKFEIGDKILDRLGEDEK